MYVLRIFGIVGIFYTQLIIGGNLLNFVLFELNWLKINNKTPYDFSYSSSLIFVLFYLTTSIASFLYSKYKFAHFGWIGLLLVSIGGVLQQCLPIKDDSFIYSSSVFLGSGIGFLNFASIIFCEVFFKSQIKFFRALSFSGFGIGMVCFAFLSSPLIAKYSLRGSALVHWALLLSMIPFIIIFYIYEKQKAKPKNCVDFNFMRQRKSSPVFEGEVPLSVPVFDNRSETLPDVLPETQQASIPQETFPTESTLQTEFYYNVPKPTIEVEKNGKFYFYFVVLIISTFAYGLCFFSTLIVFPHYMASSKWNIRQTAYSLGFTGACYFFTRLVFTVVGHSRKFDVIISFLSTCILACILSFIYKDLINTTTGKMTYAFMYGFGFAYWHVLVDSITKTTFGRCRVLDLNSIFGLTLAISASIAMVISKTLIGDDRSFDEHFNFMGGSYFVMSVGGMICKISVLWSLPNYFDKKKESASIS